MRVVLSGGGTGGHIYPALALADELKRLRPNVTLCYIGTREGMESSIVPAAGIPFTAIRAQGIVRRRPFDAARGVAALLGGFFASRRILREMRPHVAVGTGGYVTAPVIYAAVRAKIPVVLHEQNALPGVANRWLSRYAHVVAVPFVETGRYFPRARKIIATGIPIRREIVETSVATARRRFMLPLDQPVVLIMSGSRGARTVNEAAVELLLGDPPPAYYLLVTGKAYYETVASKFYEAFGPAENWHRKGIHVYPYLEQMEHALAAADLVVARAGATTIAEVTARGLPSILVPSPNVTHDHQRFNAEVLRRSGAATLLLDEECTGNRLGREVRALLEDEARRRRMASASSALGRPDAGKRLAEIILNLAGAAAAGSGPRGGDRS